MTPSFNRALIVGASSGIGAELARQLAARGCRVALVARREPELTVLADAIQARAGTAAPQRAWTYAHDVTDYEAIPGLFQDICRDLGGLDLFFYAAGVMPQVATDEYDFLKDRAMIETNVLGAIAWTNEAARRFAAAGSGSIVGISSVSADRGRRGQPVYCASKAALETYLEGVRNRVGRLGVQVLTIKPGPVDTPMTKGLDKLPMMISPNEAASEILRAVERQDLRTYVPWKWAPIMAVLRAIPSPIFQKMNL